MRLGDPAAAATEAVDGATDTVGESLVVAAVGVVSYCSCGGAHERRNDMHTTNRPAIHSDSALTSKKHIVARWTHTT